MTMQIAPSILAADFARLADEAAAVAGVADWLHVDVMDGHFVPNLTIGLPVVEALLKHADLPVDCHLMIEDPDRWAPGYAEAGARNVTIHAEAARGPVRTLRAIRAAGARAGLGINPATPVEPYADLLPELDMLLLMTVEPGYGGQPFLDLVLPKVRRARELVAAFGAAIWLQVDGGVSEETIGRCAEAGADVFVAGLGRLLGGDPAGRRGGRGGVRGGPRRLPGRRPGGRGPLAPRTGGEHQQHRQHRRAGLSASRPRWPAGCGRACSRPGRAGLSRGSPPCRAAAGRTRCPAGWTAPAPCRRSARRAPAPCRCPRRLPRR